MANVNTIWMSAILLIVLFILGSIIVVVNDNSDAFTLQDDDANECNEQIIRAVDPVKATFVHSVGPKEIEAPIAPIEYFTDLPVVGNASPGAIYGARAADSVIMRTIISEPNDEESITVLKDASSTAIYGSQGANDVIIVTTDDINSGRTSDRVSTLSSATTNFLAYFAEKLGIVEERKELVKEWSADTEVSPLKTAIRSIGNYISDYLNIHIVNPVKDNELGRQCRTIGPIGLYIAPTYDDREFSNDQAAGIQILEGRSDIRIRGIDTTTQAEPLYIIDGIQVGHCDRFGLRPYVTGIIVPIIQGLDIPTAA